MPRWPYQQFGLQRSSNGKLYFSRRWFFIDNFFDMRDMKIKRISSCWPRRAGSKPAVFDLERSISKSDHRSGQVRSRSGHDQSRSSVYISKRPDEPSRLAQFARLYLHSVASYWRKTACGLMWTQMTFTWPPIISCEWIVTDGVSGHDPGRIEWFRWRRLDGFSIEWI